MNNVLPGEYTKNKEDKGGDRYHPPSDPALKSDRCVVPAKVVSHLLGAKVSGRNPDERPDFYSTFLKELVIPCFNPGSAPRLQKQQ